MSTSTSDKKKLVDQTLTDIYYQPTHMWRGDKAIELLIKETKIGKKMGYSMDFVASIMAGFFT